MSIFGSIQISSIPHNSKIMKLQYRYTCKKIVKFCSNLIKQTDRLMIREIMTIFKDTKKTQKRCLLTNGKQTKKLAKKLW